MEEHRFEEAGSEVEDRRNKENREEDNEGVHVQLEPVHPDLSLTLEAEVENSEIGKLTLVTRQQQQEIPDSNSRAVAPARRSARQAKADYHNRGLDYTLQANLRKSRQAASKLKQGLKEGSL